MKKLLFYSLFLFLSVNTFGQENKLLIGASFSPDYDYRSLKSTGKTNEGISADGLVDWRNEEEIGKFGYTTGINAIYNFSELFGIEIGVQYSEKGYQTKWTKVITLEEEPFLPERFKEMYKYQYIDIPLKANFTFGRNKLHYIATVGVAAHFLTDVKYISIVDYGNDTDKRTDAITRDYNHFNISPLIGVGIEYKITDKINVRAIPTFKYNLLSTVNSKYQSERLWNVGLEIGVFYGIK